MWTGFDLFIILKHSFQLPFVLLGHCPVVTSLSWEFKKTDTEDNDVIM